MKAIKKRLLALIALPVVAVAALSGCTAADTANQQLSQAAEAFEIQRVITIINGVTNDTMFEIEGRCSIETADSYLAGGLQVTCKISDEGFVTHFVGLSDNVSFIAQQNDAIDVSEYHHRVIIRPETVIPEIDFDVSGN